MSAVKLSSADGTMHVWACEVCKHTMPNEEIAASHCQCQRCGTIEKRTFYIECDACQAISYAERRAAEAEAFMRREVLTEWAGPVYDDHTGDFYDDTQHLIECLWDEGLEHDEIRARRVIPCDVVPAATPSLSEYVDEHWSEGAEDSLMDGGAKAILDAIEDVVAELAPDRWQPRNERLDMAVVVDAR